MQTVNAIVLVLAVGLLSPMASTEQIPRERLEALVAACFPELEGVRTSYVVEGPWRTESDLPPEDTSGLEAAQQLGTLAAERRESVAVVDGPRFMLQTARSSDSPPTTYLWSGQKAYTFAFGDPGSMLVPGLSGASVLHVEKRLPPEPDRQRFLFVFLSHAALPTEPALVGGGLLEAMKASPTVDASENPGGITIMFAAGEEDSRFRVKRRWTLVVQPEPTPRLVELRLDVLAGRPGQPDDEAMLQSRTIASVGAWAQYENVVVPRRMTVARAVNKMALRGTAGWHVEHQTYERSDTGPANLSADDAAELVKVDTPVRVRDMSLGIHYNLGESWVRVGRRRHELDEPILEVLDGAKWIKLAQTLDRH